MTPCCERPKEWWIVSGPIMEHVSHKDKPISDAVVRSAVAVAVKSARERLLIWCVPWAEYELGHKAYDIIKECEHCSASVVLAKLWALMGRETANDQKYVRPLRYPADVDLNVYRCMANAAIDAYVKWA